MSLDKNNNLKKNYSTIKSKFYDLGLKKYRKKIHKIFLNSFNLKPNTKILDVGTTELLDDHENYLLNNYNHKESLTCFSNQNLKKLKDAFPSINILQGDGKKMPIEDKSYNIVYSNATIEHVGSDDEQIKFLSELFRVSSEGVFVTTPNRFFPLDLHTMLPLIHFFPKKIHRKILNILNYKFLSKEENLNLLSKNDLERMCKILDIKNYEIKKIKISLFTSNFLLIIKKN